MHTRAITAQTIIWFAVGIPVFVLSAFAIISTAQGQGFSILESEFGNSLLRQYRALRDSFVNGTIGYVIQFFPDNYKELARDASATLTAISLGLVVIPLIPWIRRNSSIYSEMMSVYSIFRPLYLLFFAISGLFFAANIIGFFGSAIYAIAVQSWIPLILWFMIAFIGAIIMISLDILRQIVVFISTGKFSMFFADSGNDDGDNRYTIAGLEALGLFVICILFSGCVLIVISAIDFFVVKYMGR